MAFCPKCGYEYKVGVTVCPDCKEKLVDRLPDESEAGTSGPDKQYKDWIALVRLTSTEMAELVVEALRIKEIPAVVKSGVGHFGYVGTQGLSSFAPVGGGYSIMVPKKYSAEAAEEAKIILGENWEKFKLVDN